MGEIRAQPPRALLFFAVFSGSDAALDQAIERIAGEYGPILAKSKRFLFDDTRYYEHSMGPALHKQLVAVDRVIAQDDLAAIKHRSNTIEAELQRESSASIPRLVNIDPGMIDDGKVMLASTKNNAHRIYVGDGIFVEVTLYLREGAWQSWPWTYPDYRRPEVHAFFYEVRAYFRKLR